jgi:leucyl/phenylalanyl-tRNA--protein transferase
MRFPDPRSTGEDGLLCIGGDLSVETLLEAYRLGVFPWPHEGLPLLWFSPIARGVLDFDEIHWPRRFLRELKAQRPDLEYKITFNEDFDRVVRECATVPRVHEKGTWILPEMQDAYKRFHRAGYAHSVECWLNGELVGGLYGVFVDGVFSGESMFHKVSDASKRCLYALVEKLKDGGVTWMDTQMVTRVLETFGGKYIPREAFLERIREAHTKHVPNIFAKADPGG